MDERVKQQIIETYRQRFFRFGDTPEGAHYSDLEGQHYRFEKLTQISDLRGKRILDYGCGLGHLYPYLLAKFGEVDYTGIDIVPEVIDFAARKYQKARFLCRDLLREDIQEDFDYVLICGVFNNAVPDPSSLLQEMIAVAFRHCKIGLAFNFISTYVNYVQEEMAYHDPLDVLKFCLNRLSLKVTMQHHYQRRDVAVYVYR
jgi:SAM-dependent methyltransferase